MIAKGAFTLVVKVGGEEIGRYTQKTDDLIEWDVALPGSMEGKDAADFELVASHVVVPPGDGRELSLLFGTVRILTQ